MIKKTFILYLIFIFLYSINVSAANLILSEIMYDLPGSDTSREWVEVYNNTGASIDLTTYKFFEANSSHNISHYQGNTILSDKEYAVIANNPTLFLNDNPNFPLDFLYDSSFSLSNAGELLALKNKDNEIVFEYFYDVNIGANGDGNSLQFSDNNKWISSLPTPGLVYVFNDAHSNSNNESSSSENNTIDNVNSSSVNSVDKNKKIVNSFVFENVKSVITGDSLSIKSTLYGTSGETINNGFFVWNFGDGSVLKNYNNREVEHIYNYPGNYTITVLYYPGDWYLKPVIIGSTKINVVESPLIITNVFYDPFLAVEILNTDKNQYDISNYIIQTNQNLTLPIGSYIGPKDKTVIILPGGSILDSVKLISPGGYVNASYNKKVLDSSVELKNININKNPALYTVNEFIDDSYDYDKYNTDILLDNQVINLSNDSVNNLENKDDNGIYKYKNLFIFIMIIFISSCTVFIIRHKNTTFVNTKDDEYALQDE